MKFVITGGCGFVGGTLAAYLHDRGHDVVAVDNMVRAGSELNWRRLESLGIEVATESAESYVEDATLKGCVVLHCAAQPSAVAGFHDPQTDYRANVEATYRVLEACRRDRAGIIYWSTNKVYSADVVNKTTTPSANLPIDGGNRSVYGATKLCGDLLCQEYATAFDLPVVVNRFSCLAGPWQFGKTEQGWVAWFVIACELGLPITLFGWNGNQVRDVLFSDDICTLIEKQALAIEEHRGRARVFQVGGGAKNAVSLRQCIAALRARGYNPKVTYNPSARVADHDRYVSDIQAVKRAYDWSPLVSVQDGLTQIIDWAKNHRNDLAQLHTTSDVAATESLR